MLPTTLNTNEVKDASGVEVEFERRSTDKTVLEFKQVAEAPNLPHRLKVSNQESGVGLALRRRSLIRLDLTSMSEVDTTLPVTDSAYIVLDTAVGAHNTTAAAKKVLAELLSFVASDGTNTTVKFDCTGTGAKCLIDGSL